jgi:hypothetical protein
MWWFFGINSGVYATAMCKLEPHARTIPNWRYIVEAVNRAADRNWESASRRIRTEQIDSGSALLAQIDA